MIFLVEPLWNRDDEALTLLDECGAPFNCSSYRLAWTQHTRWRDASFAARTEDGTRAAIALLRRHASAQSLPLAYGGIVATRALNEREVATFLRTARRNARVYELRSFSVSFAHDPAHAGGLSHGTTHVVHLNGRSEVGAKFSKTARSKIARAKRAGGLARPSSNDPEAFLELYGRASRAWTLTYPFDVLRALAAAGILRLYDVELDGAIESSMAIVHGGSHWMYWLGAQSDVGRGAELGYLAMATVLADAQASGTHAVNLGASAGLPGVRRFKEQFGAIEVPIVEHRSALELAVTGRSIIVSSLTRLDSRRRRRKS